MRSFLADFPSSAWTNLDLYFVTFCGVIGDFWHWLVELG